MRSWPAGRRLQAVSAQTTRLDYHRGSRISRPSSSRDVSERAKLHVGGSRSLVPEQQMLKTNACRASQHLGTAADVIARVELFENKLTFHRDWRDCHVHAGTGRTQPAR